MNEKPEPVSWWIYRDLNGTALDVDDEQPVTQIIEAPNGIHVGKIVRPSPDRYEVHKKIWPEKKRDSREQFGVGGEWVLVGTIHRITKTQYDTYQTMGLFEESENETD